MESIDWETTCHLCLEQNTGTLIMMDGNNLENPIFSHIEECLSINLIAENILPFSICEDCKFKLLIFYKFRKTSIEHYVSLKNMRNIPSELPNLVKLEVVDALDLEMTIDDNCEEYEQQDYMSAQKREDYGPPQDELLKFMDSNNYMEEEESDYQEDRKQSENVNHKVLNHTKKKKTSVDCLICEQVLDSDIDLKIHIESDHKSDQLPYSCRICEKEFNSALSIFKHRNSHNNDLNCDYCLETFETPEELKIHKKTHTGQPPYKCPYCTVMFNYTGNMKRHIRKNHNNQNQKQHRCEYCKIILESHEELKLHLEAHITDYPFTCENCLQKFKTQLDLEFHLSTRHNIPCQYCEQKFLHSALLRNHVKLVHPDVYKTQKGVSTYQSTICEFCHNTFLNRSNLHRHLKQKHFFKYV